MKIVNVGYRKTNYLLIDSGKNLLGVDVGWPGTFVEYAGSLKAHGYAVSALNRVIVTHFHVDHAGIAGELMSRGVEVIVFDVQESGIPEMEAMMVRKKMPYVPIDAGKIIRLSPASSRGWLLSLGIDGEVVHTPGHSDDSVSLVLDDGTAFIGDLHPEFQVMEDDSVTRDSWRRLKALGVKRAVPGHGPEFPIGR